MTPQMDWRLIYVEGFNSPDPHAQTRPSVAVQKDRCLLDCLANLIESRMFSSMNASDIDDC